MILHAKSIFTVSLHAIFVGQFSGRQASF